MTGESGTLQGGLRRYYPLFVRALGEKRNLALIELQANPTDGPALRRLARATSALERMRSGQFGVCESCEKRIPFRFLFEAPDVELCGSCESEAR